MRLLSLLRAAGSLSESKVALIRSRFAAAQFIQDLGVELVDFGEGWVETRMAIVPRFFQGNGFVHAGVQTTLADHTAGTAAATASAPGTNILSIEFKLNLLRPAVGDFLRCRADVIRSGRSISVVEAKVFTIASNQEKLVSVMTATMAVTQVGLPRGDTDPSHK